MTLKEKFLPFVDDIDLINDIPNKEFGLRNADKCEKIADDYAIEFAEWKDDNFLMYGNKTYYAKTSYFDVTKYVGKEKPTKYYTTKQLLEIYKEQKKL